MVYALAVSFEGWLEILVCWPTFVQVMTKKSASGCLERFVLLLHL